MTSNQQTGSRAYLFSIVLVAIIGGLLFGYDTAVVSGAEQALDQFFRSAADFTYTSWMHGFTASSALIGCVIGGAISGLLASRFGRKRSLVMAAVLFLEKMQPKLTALLVMLRVISRKTLLLLVWRKK